MATRHAEITEAGVQVVGISVDTPQQNSALIGALDLPFPILSDSDRSGAITPYDLADPDDPREIARPAVVLVTSGGDEAFRIASLDFADRPTEDEVVEAIRALSLPPTVQHRPTLGPAEPGPRAMPFELLNPYFRGARFAVVALSRRHPDLGEDAARYIAEMDRYMEAVTALFRRSKATAEDKG